MLEDYGHLLRNILPMITIMIALVWMMVSLVCIAYPVNYMICSIPLDLIIVYALKEEGRKIPFQTDDRTFDPEAIEAIERERRKTKQMCP
jgi:hypothetical protein